MGIGDLFKRGKKKNQPTELEVQIQLTAAYAKMWAQFFDYFSDNLSGRTITEKDENEFFKIITVLANRFMELKFRLGEELSKPDKITQFLQDVVSLHHLQTLSEAEFSSMQVRWHEIFINIHKARGRLLHRMPAPSESRKKAPPGKQPPPDEQHAAVA